MTNAGVYQPKHHIRFVTASSLFDGHDASINIMRRILQASGAEVIHLGHNRSVEEVVNAAIQEDAQGIAISSYQGGHVEYFKYMYDLLKEKGAPNIRIYGGGGGVIIPREIKELHDYGIAWIFSPEDGRKLGLQGMINRMLEECDFSTVSANTVDQIEKLPTGDVNAVAKLITLAELHVDKNREAAAAAESLLEKVKELSQEVPVVGITGTGGAGKSSLTDELIRRFINELPD
ncbi:MAG: methylmalonyl-CoA mutase, partial [Neobacillus sp.]|nr:methylmalonyl-CoA mutase [Neobacillus sp.]